MVPAYRYTVDAIFNFAKHHGWLEGLASTYATEGQMWRRYTPREEHGDRKLMGEGESLKNHYGLPDSALEFYNVHSDANDEHGGIYENIIRRYCTTLELQRKALAAGRFRWDNHESRHDIVYRYFGLGQE